MGMTLVTDDCNRLLVVRDGTRFMEVGHELVYECYVIINAMLLKIKHWNLPTQLQNAASVLCPNVIKHKLSMTRSLDDLYTCGQDGKAPNM